MKKILLSFLAFTAILFSCQDDDIVLQEPIPVSQAENDDNAILPNQSLIIDLLDNDQIEWATEIIYVDKETVEGGELVINDNGTYTYIPKKDFIGEDSFSYTICTGGVVSEDTCSTGIVEITIEPINYTLTSDDYNLIVQNFGSVNGLEGLVDDLEENRSFDVDDSDDFAWNDDQLEQVLNFIVVNNFSEAKANDFFRVTYTIQENDIDNTVIQLEEKTEEVEEEEQKTEPIFFTFSDEDFDLVVAEFTGVSGFEDQVDNLDRFGNFNRSGSSATWGDYQLLQAISVVLNSNFTFVEGSLINVTFSAFNEGSSSDQTKVVQFIDEEFEYFVEDEFVGGLVSSSFNIPSSISDYYSELTSTANLFGLLNDITVDKHTIDLTYTPGVWNTLQDSDVNPNESSEVLLIYGFNEDESQANSRTRGRESIATDAGGSPNFWNREHVFPRSLGSPNLEFVGPGSDAHHLRPSDPNINSSRSNDRFSDGLGQASFGTTDGGWYPGDEWIGDVARMMMYMYVRYQGQCLPSAVANGDINSIDPNMVDLFLKWNIEDPVSDFEKQRNDVIEGAQGNRNPFIDNPYLATLIWGGDAAENTWE